MRSHRFFDSAYATPSRVGSHVYSRFRGNSGGFGVWGTFGVIAITLLPVVASLLPAWAGDSTFFSGFSRSVGLATNTAVVAGVTLVVAMGLGIPLGKLLFHSPLNRNSLWSVGLLAMCMVPPYLVVSGWMALLSIHVWPLKTLVAGWLSGMIHAPLASVLCGLVLQAVPRSCEESGLLCGTRHQVFWHITVPQAAWGLVGVALVITILSTVDMTVTDLLLVRTFSEEIFAEFQLNRSPAQAASTAVPLIVGLLVLGMAFFRFARPLSEPSESMDASRFESRAGTTQRPTPWERLFLVTVLFCLVVLPLGAIAWRIGHLGAFIQSCQLVADELGYGFVLATVAAVISTLPAWMPAYAMSHSPTLRPFVLSWAILLMALPAPLLAVGLTALLNHNDLRGWFYDSPAIIVMAYLIRFIPYHVLILASALRMLPPEVEEAAACDGASRFQVLRHVMVPLFLKPAVFGAGVVFILSLGEVGASILVVPPGTTTIAIRFYTLLHYGVYAEAASVGLILALIISVLSLGLVLLARRCWS